MQPRNLTAIFSDVPCRSAAVAFAESVGAAPFTRRLIFLQARDVALTAHPTSRARIGFGLSSLRDNSDPARHCGEVGKPFSERGKQADGGMRMVHSSACRIPSSTSTLEAA